jgi:hypothetical protein
VVGCAENNEEEAEGGVSTLLPTIIYPATVSDYNKRLLAAAGGTDTSVKACTTLDSSTRTSWTLFYAALVGFSNEDPGWFGLGSRMDRAESYGAELAAWQDKLSKVCALGVPQFNPNTPPTDLAKITQYVAWGVGAFAFAYAVGKVADVVIPILPKRRAA